MRAFLRRLQWDIILSGIFSFIIIILLLGGATYLFTFFLPKTTIKSFKAENIEFTKEGIEESKRIEENFLDKTSKLRIAKLYENPLPTPSFISNSPKLKQYLESNTVKITINGELAEAYLYIKTGKINIENESVYFWIVDGKSDGGHLLASENLAQGAGNEFLYDLEKLPIVQLPYSLDKSPSYLNIVENYLNKDISYKPERQYYVGAFVSTTILPNQVENFEIRYKCKTGSDNCSIVVND